MAVTHACEHLRHDESVARAQPDAAARGCVEPHPVARHALVIRMALGHANHLWRAVTHASTHAGKIGWLRMQGGKQVVTTHANMCAGPHANLYTADVPEIASHLEMRAARPIAQAAAKQQLILRSGR